MPRQLPKTIAENKWKQLQANRTSAIRINSDDYICLRLGLGKGVFLEASPIHNGGRLLNSIDYDSGAVDFLLKFQENTSILIGRASPSVVKIIHPYVSRNHLELTLMGDVLLAKDLGSINGSFYNTDNFCFDVDKYIEAHPVKMSADGTLDAIHEAFGPTLDDFLKQYSEKKEKQNDTSSPTN